MYMSSRGSFIGSKGLSFGVYICLEIIFFRLISKMGERPCERPCLIYGNTLSTYYYYYCYYYVYNIYIYNK